MKRWVILVIATLICVAGCGAQQQEAAAPATMTPNQQQAFRGCMKQKRQVYILPLGPEFVDTAAKQQGLRCVRCAGEGSTVGCS